MVSSKIGKEDLLISNDLLKMEMQSLVQELAQLYLNFLTKHILNLLGSMFHRRPLLVGSLKHISEYVFLLVLGILIVLFITCILKYHHTKKLCTLGLMEVTSNGCVCCQVKLI